MAAGVVIGGSVALAIALYFVLLLVAVVGGGGLGGPLALPGMALMALLGSAATTIVVLFPVTVLAEVLCGRVRRARWIAEIVVASALLVAAVSAGAGVSLLRGGTLDAVVPAGAVATAVLLVLLGVYWWSAHAAAMLLEIAGRAWRWAAASWRARVA